MDISHMDTSHMDMDMDMDIDMGHMDMDMGHMDMGGACGVHTPLTPSSLPLVPNLAASSLI
eukprot:3615467-Prymnesium_polylepis.1